jgi:hypothetical protein
LGESSAVVDHAIARTSSSRATADAAFELLAELLGEPSFELAEPYAGGCSHLWNGTGGWVEPS